jgi:hypothetical protein
VAVGVTVLVPCGSCGPLHAPLATQAVTLFDDQLSVALCPKVMVLGLTVIARFGATGSTAMGKEPCVLKEQLTKAEACAQIATRPATKASVRERDLLFFDTCMAALAIVKTRPERDLVGSDSLHTRLDGASVRAFSSVYAPNRPLTREGTGRRRSGLPLSAPTWRRLHKLTHPGGR